MHPAMREQHRHPEARIRRQFEVLGFGDKIILEHEVPEEMTADEAEQQDRKGEMKKGIHDSCCLNGWMGYYIE
jgi:hypothetical protein